MIFTTSLYVIFNALNLDKIVKWFSTGDGIDYTGLIAYLTAGLCLFTAFFILFAHRRTIKPFAVIFIILSATATYFISKYSVAIDTSMVMNVTYTDPMEVSGLLSVHMIPYILFLMVLPILAVINVNITFQSTANYLTKSLLVFAAAISIGVGLVYAKYNSIHRAVNISDKYIIHTLVPVNYIRSTASVIHQSIRSYNRKNRKEVEITGHVSTQDDLVVVLAIGEASRQKNFSLYGYDRNNTNPVLSKEKKLHILNGKARIGSTYLALREILKRKDITLPAIISKLGIDTSCYVNYTLNDNCDPVVEVQASNCGHGGQCYDEDVIPLLERDLETYASGYRFIVLHFGGGSHGPKYWHRFPPEFQIFKPQCLEADVVNQCTIEQLYNSYDNSVLYTDYVVGETIKRLDHSGVPYVFIYLSDHGESLMEEDRLFHGMPPGIPLPPEQAQIPLIVKSSIPVSIVQREEYNQQDVFDSVLDLFSIETEILNKERTFIRKLNSKD
jgi:lipid A ethanolaminephosphotransferase